MDDDDDDGRRTTDTGPWHRLTDPGEPKSNKDNIVKLLTKNIRI